MITNFYDLYHSQAKFQKEVIGEKNFTYREIISVLKKLRGIHSVLDIGCGVGTIDFYLAFFGKEVTGIDISKKPKVALRQSEQVILDSSNKYYYEQVLLPLTLKEKKVDVYHAPGNMGISPFSLVPIVLTVHNVIPLQVKGYFSEANFPFISESSYYLRLTSSCFFSKKIITVTNYVKRQLVQKLGVSGNKITVVNPGVKISGEETSLPFKLIRRRYILNHGGIDMRKNLERLIDAFKTVGNLFPQLKLVITGYNPYLKPKLQEKAKSLGLINKIVFTGYVNESILWTLIRNSSCVCYPSLMEGFGSPVLEGFIGGVPVISSNRSSIPEISDKAAILVNPISTHEISSAIIKILTDEKLAKRLVIKGLMHVKKYRWDKTIEKTLNIYKRVLK